MGVCVWVCGCVGVCVCVCVCVGMCERERRGGDVEHTNMPLCAFSQHLKFTQRCLETLSRYLERAMNLRQGSSSVTLHSINMACLRVFTAQQVFLQSYTHLYRSSTCEFGVTEL